MDLPKNTLQFGKNINPDYFIFNSKYTLNLHLNKNYPNNLKDRFRHLHPPMDLEYYKSFNIDNLKKEGADFIQQDTFNVGIFGRIIPSKRPYAVLDIIDMAKKDKLNIRFNFIGGGKLEEDIRKEIIKRNMSDYAFVHGMKDEPFKYICNMDCILHMCEYESLSRAIRESMYFKIPIVAYNGAGNKELWEIVVKILYS